MSCFFLSYSLNASCLCAPLSPNKFPRFLLPHWLFHHCCTVSLPHMSHAHFLTPHFLLSIFYWLYVPMPLFLFLSDLFCKMTQNFLRMWRNVGKPKDIFAKSYLLQKIIFFFLILFKHRFRETADLFYHFVCFFLCKISMKAWAQKNTSSMKAHAHKNTRSTKVKETPYALLEFELGSFSWENPF